MPTKECKKTIPCGWRQVRLGDIANVVMGQSPSSTAYNELGNGLSLVQGNHDIKNRKTVTSIWTSEITKTAEIGEVILTVRAPVGCVGLASEKVCLGRGVCAIKPREDQITKAFLYKFLELNESKWKMLEQGSTFTAVNGSDIRKLAINLPPLPEQHRIVSILETWDKAIDELKKKIEIKRILKRWLLEELTTGKKRLQEFEGDWKSVRLGDICEIKRGGSPRPIEDYITEDLNGLNWLRIGDVPIGGRYIYQTKEKIKKEGLKKTTVVREDDFILSNSMSYGRPYIMKVTACIHDGWLALKDIISSVNSNYLYYLLSSNKVQSIFTSISAGSGVQNLKKETVADVVLRIPLIMEQEAIAKVLASSDNEIDLEEKKLSLLQSQKIFLLNALMTEAKRTSEAASAATKQPPI